MISSIGGSDIDILLASYRALEEKPIRRLETQRNTIDNRVSLFTSLKSKLRSLENLAEELSYTDSTSVFGSKSSNVSDDTYLEVTATSSAVATSHTITINQLAKADQIVSNQYTLAGTDLSSTLGAGTFTFDVTINGTAYQVSADITAGEDNETVLNNIVSAVNNTADIEISASIVKDTETTGRLIFTSDESGADFKMSLADVSGSLLSTMSMSDSVQMSGTSGGYIHDVAELNAKLEIDGISIERNSNSIENAVGGLTLSLHKTHAAGEAPVTVNVTNDVENIKAKLQEFIDSYNAIMDFIRENTSVNATTYERSSLSGDFAVSNLKLELRSILSQPVTGLTAGDPTILSQLGITPDRQGKLSISDSDTLDEYLEGNLDQVQELFTSTDGIASRLTQFLEDYTDGEGILEKRKDVLQGQITMINGRIDRLEESVDRKIENYRVQFSQLQAAYAMYNAQSSSLGSIVQSGYF